MDKSRDSAMEMGGENLFSHDPFLSLDNDLDDVSEVIRNNLFGEHPNLFDASRTPSPQYFRDTNIFMNTNNLDGDLVFKNNSNYSVPSSNVNTYDKEIGELVTLLQEENPLLSSPSTSPHQMDGHFVQIKPDYSMMDTSSNEVYDVPPQMDSSRLQYASTSGLPVEYHQMSEQKPVHFGNQYNQFDQLPPQQNYPTQYMFELPRASSSSAIHGMLGTNPVQQIVDETPLIRPLSDQNLYSYSNAPMSAQQNGVHFDVGSSSDDNTKQELIKMLLEMKPGDFERLRSQKNSKQPKMKASSPTPVDPVRKRSSLQLTTSPPLLVSVGSSPSLESAGKQPVYSPELISPLSSIGPSWREGEEESDDELSNMVPTRKGPKTERRTAHNLIEKKYRCSINDRINYLKEMLAPEETKLSKSATLRKAIDHINSLRQHNVDLIRENELLKKSIKALGAEVPIIVNNKYSKHRPTSTAISIADESSESAGSVQSSNSSSPHAVIKKSQQMLNQSRVSLCVFLFMVVVMNPFAFLFGPSTMDASAHTNNIIGRIPVQHRTLKSFDTDYPFDDDTNDPNDFWHRAFTRHAVIWLINLFIVFMILTRLLVYGEPVTDRRSPTWITFLKSKKLANDAINACNYKEAQRQLSDALYILGRSLPRPGGIDELLSVSWQVIRHILNGIWIGRWFSRRRRSKDMSAPAVCRSHASTALVYHQLNQLNLLGIDALEMSRFTGLNLALSAVNLAESAGISKDGITHFLRADIYIHTALTTKLCLPRFLGRLTSAYFLQRARRHVQKASSVDGVEMRRYRWVFHPLAQTFLADANVINEILINNRQMAHFPFQQPYISPKPIDRLTSAFKMHLLALLLNQLNSAVTTLHLVDFVDISHLLLSMCTSELQQSETPAEENQRTKDEAGGDWEASTKGQGDELCTWWAHLISCGLYWKFCDYSHAQKHYALIRKCPKPLLNSNLALGVGMALCTRKICMEDQNKKEFVNMVWFHVKESFVYMRKEEPLNPRKTSSMALTMNQLVRSLTFEWLLNSMLDVWRLNLDKRQHWEQPAPNQMRQVYREVLGEFGHSGIQSTDRIKVLVFKIMSRLLDGANPMTTWRLLSRQCTELIADNDQTASGISPSQFEIIKRLRDDIKLATNIKIIE